MKTLLESCRVAPPPGAVAEQSLPLSFFDIGCLHFQMHQLLFYEFTCSKPYFFETLLPKLKESLSTTLKHFFPLAGNIVYPLSPDKKPVIRYRAGDSVLFTISESGDGFDDLVGNHARDADKFYDFVPQNEPVIDESGHKLIQVLAVQVTLFPDRGVCIGFNTNHSVWDATSFEKFLKFWASINKLGGEEQFLITQNEFSPVFDRSLINYNSQLDTVFWDQIRTTPFTLPSFPLPTNRVRATFVFSRSEILNMKNMLQARIPGLINVSSFVVITAYVWTCLAKSLLARVSKGTVYDDDELQVFTFAVDLKARMNPPVPGNYFGNCLALGLARIRYRELVGEEGFVRAAQAITEEIKYVVTKNDKILDDAVKRITDHGGVVEKPVLAVAGFTRFDLYNIDFGWGMARKAETVSIDGWKSAISLCKSRDSEGGLEVGLSLPKVEMDAFAAIVSGKNCTK